jgi:ATP-binding cassette subfamily B protein
MDCGPAALKCLLEGFGVRISYGRLREACQTDVDGTSIDTLEDIGRSLGLGCEQVVVPADHVLLPEADVLPAIAVVRLPSGFTHFVVVWRRNGPLVQIMDPASGRRWVGASEFTRILYSHTARVPVDALREWIASDAFVLPLKARLRALGCAGTCAEAVEEARRDPEWGAMAALDGAARMTDALVKAGAIARGAEAGRLVRALVRSEREGRRGIPEAYMAMRPAPPGEDGEPHAFLRGAILVHAGGTTERAKDAPPLSPELSLALAERPLPALRTMLSLLRADGWSPLPTIALALLAALVATALEAALFRGLFDARHALVTVRHRLGAIAMLAVLSGLVLTLEASIAREVLRCGRHLELRLRSSFLVKIPRLVDRYFQSRPVSDMAERGHAVHAVRQIPDFGAQAYRAACDLAVTTAAIVWIDPPSAPWAVLCAFAALFCPLTAQPLLVELDLRTRSHLGALSRFYLDALLGLVPVRAHGAEAAVRREHEGLLVEWARSARALVRVTVATEALQAVAVYAALLGLVFSYAGRKADPAAVLLLVYWALTLPSSGQELALALRQYPAQRNRTLRLLEPLGAPEPPGDGDESACASADVQATGGAAIRFEGVSVVAGGHTLLEAVDLSLSAGEHVAIVGESGAGKSSLVGVLLGWHRAASGRVVVNGAALEGARLEALRQETAWVDPGVQIWNRSLVENVAYGGDAAPDDFGEVLDAAHLHPILRALPDGMMTRLGEGGGLVSGGEGQRVRLARALARRSARLVLLDEPFRGLDRELRRALLDRARRWWRASTVLCVTHDVGETQAFDRVIVVHGGRVVEDGPPEALLRRSDSRYATMLEAERRLRESIWSDPVWRRLRIEDGKLES